MGPWSTILFALAISAIQTCYACEVGDKFNFSDGHLGCKVYFSCEDGNITELECPPGQEFDGYSRQCMDDSIVQCQETQTAIEILTRKKRQATMIMRDFMEPVFTQIIDAIRNFVTLQTETFTTKIILPTVLEIVSDREARWYCKQIIWDLKAAYAPIISDMLKQQSWDSPPGKKVFVSNARLRTAYLKVIEIEPFVKKLSLKYGPILWNRIGDNFMLCYDTIYRLKKAGAVHSGVLFDSVKRFMSKHSNLFISDGSSVHSTYSFTEITNDLRPIEMTAIQIFLQYLSESTNPILNWAFNPNSLLLKTLMGTGAEIYAVPSNSAIKKLSQPAVPARPHY